jgi:hypothetical protein
VQGRRGSQAASAGADSKVAAVLPCPSALHVWIRLQPQDPRQGQAHAQVRRCRRICNGSANGVVMVGVCTGRAATQIQALARVRLSRRILKTERVSDTMRICCLH